VAVSDLAEDGGRSAPLSRSLWAFGSIWVAIVAGSFAFNMLQLKSDVPELARLQTPAAHGEEVEPLRAIARRQRVKPEVGP
jgi:hypothetical protein